MGFAAIAQNARYASKYDLDRFDSSQSLGRWSWPTDTNKLESRWLEFLCLLSRYGYTGIKECEGAITDAEWRTKHQTRSSRTTFRALAGLEKKGYIRRYRLRLGKANKTIWIEFLPKLGALLNFSRVEKKEKTARNVVKILHLPKRQTSDPEILDPVLTPDILGFKSYASRAYEHKKRRWDPIAYTARCLTSGRDRSRISVQINAELRGEHNKSAIDWAYWAARWPEMTILERENTFLRELMPALSEASSPEASSPEASSPEASSPEASCGQVYDLGNLEKDELTALYWAKQAAQADQRGEFD